MEKIPESSYHYQDLFLGNCTPYNGEIHRRRHSDVEVMCLCGGSLFVGTVEVHLCVHEKLDLGQYQNIYTAIELELDG